MRNCVVSALCLLLTPAVAVADDGLLARGKQIFIEQAQPSCAICHTLSDAGSTGAIGPDLDELKPSRQQVRDAVQSGVGIMPGFEETLSAEDINAVALYVATVTGGATD